MFKNSPAIIAAILLCFTFFPAAGQTIPNHYTLILDDPPAAQRFSSREAMRTKEAVDYRAQIEKKQKALRAELAKRKIQVTGSVSTVLNAIFVIAPKDRVAELKSLPGVKAVVPSRRYRKELNRATQLLNAPAAWNALGGLQNAGSGMKIAILDSGIDQTHPAFQDSSLPALAGFPICSGSDCAYTNNKVIVARSYVRQLAAGSDPNPAADSRPDDYSPRDRDGHGTAVASCAAGVPNTGLVPFSGFAPKAYLGNYKIYGSPGVNDSTSDAVIIQAAEDAYHDGMDVINFSTGGPAFSGPLDTGAVCGNPSGVACDLVAQTFETLSNQGLIIVAAAGNEGYDGVSSNFPQTFGSISSPAFAPSVIAAGASTNSHEFAVVVSVPGPNAPGSLQNIVADPGDGSIPTGSISAPLVDVTQLGNDGLACSALPAASLVGAIALIERGTCTFTTKATNAQAAGARGVVFYMADSSATISPGGLSNISIPAVMISNTAGVGLKSYISSNPGGLVTVSGAGIEQSAQANDLAYFSSAGPTTGDNAIKPDLLAVGTNVYMAAEDYDIAGVLYSSDRYGAANGTSFATPMVAGAAALVKQRHPGFTPAQVKSALANTAAPSVQTDDSGHAVDVRSVGAGLLDVGAAVNATVTSVPSSISFGAVTSQSLPKSQQLQLTNAGASAVSLTVAVTPAVASSGASVQVDKTSLTINPGATQTLNVSLAGSLSQANAYSGVVTVQGQGVSLRIPYLYLVSDNNSAANLIPLTGTSFDGTVGGGIPQGILAIRLVDSVGLPVVGAPVTFTARGGTIQAADSVTDQFGIAAAQPVLGTQPGRVSFTASAGSSLQTTFSGYARIQPTISAGGIADSASFDATRPVAPGSYISIFGAGLSDFTDYAQSATLPLAIDYAFVSFDVASAGISIPGHLTYVSPGQVNVQVPWELQGQSSAQVKVTIDYSNGNVVSLALSDYAPAIFKVGDVAAALDQSNAVVTASNPVARGQVVQLFANGLGPVTNQPASGEPAPASPLSRTTTLPVVTIGGQTASVQFSGLTPGYAGLYQINAIVPQGLAAGNQPVAVSIGGRSSSPVNLPVK
jgi:minor extracellular serine protease Vpr